MTAAKDIPIIFSAPMVRAILDGRKTQTRRLVKPAPGYIESSRRWTWPMPKRLLKRYSHCPMVVTASREWWEYLPDEAFPAQPGDVLWVRETWQTYCPLWDGVWCGHGTQEGEARDHKQVYRADDKSAWLITYSKDGEVFRVGPPKRWRSPIHMPKWASRIRLPVKSVRVEQLQNISYDDCGAEGIEAAPTDDGRTVYAATPKLHSSCAIEAFCKLWESIHGEGSWDSNPWVWVYEWEPIR